MVSLATLYADGFDRTDPSPSQVYLCHVLSLPFRLRIGDSYSFPDSQATDFRLYFRNRYRVPPHGVSTKVLLEEEAKQGSRDFFTTKALVVFKAHHDERQAMQLLNGFIIAYASISKSTPPFHEPVTPLNERELARHLQWEIRFFCPMDYKLTHSDFEKLINHTSPLTCSGITCTPICQITDLPQDKLSQIPAAYTRHQQHIFYEYAFYAQTRMRANDYTEALIMACIALESAHATFLKSTLQNALSAYKLNKKFIDNISRARGFYHRVKTTAAVFMLPAHRPPSDLLRKCENAIRMRNDIIHSNVVAGKFKSREYKPLDISHACDVVLETYVYFVQAIEKLFPEPTTAGPKKSV